MEFASVYTISGANAGPSNATASANSTSLPDILKRSGSTNKRKKRRRDDSKLGSIDHQLSKIELIQDFEFPEASHRIRSTRDGLHIVATGTYKPQIRVWECEQLALKFERHTDADNVDFILLSDDWTKSLHLQSDRTLELHSQGGTHAKIRIPKFGRALGYHFPSADAIVGAAGKEVYRLNLDQGRFLAPFELGQGHAESHGSLTGVNAVDVNPAHGLASFGTEGAGVVELWDMRIRKRAGLLSIMTSTILDAALLETRRSLPGVIPEPGSGTTKDEVAIRNAVASLSVTALSSADNGLNMAVGTSTGHILLYDLRMNRPYQSKDQGFGLPIKTLIWPGSNLSGLRNRSSAAQTEYSSLNSSDAQSMVLSADAKIIKVWHSESGENAATITPPSAQVDLNHVHHLPGTGLVLSAVEGTQMAAWYVPLLGPAPKWCSFLDSLTTEMDGGSGAGSASAAGAQTKGVYEDFKFVDQAELERLNMSNLVGTSMLRPYMHGFFISLSLYEKARLLANPTAYADARERALRARLEKEAESRIRSGGRAERALKALDAEQSRRDGKGKKAAAAVTTADGKAVTVNRDLAKKIAEKADKEEKKKARIAAKANVDDASAAAAGAAAGGADSLLEDDRFKELFTNPEYEVDVNSREFALLNPSTAAQMARQAEFGEYMSGGEEEDEDDDDDDDEEEDESVQDSGMEEDSEDEGADSDSSEETNEIDPRRMPARDEPITSRSFDNVRGRGRGKGRGNGRRGGPVPTGLSISRGAGAEEGVGAGALDEEARSGRKQRRAVSRSASKNVMRK
ncbi:Small ribosomal subunit biogenesis [Tilletia horrida]|uniref:Small ribosomal subunit biogenesis n=1 Tax=Tilletia horrida TaxID=155126 RepID=A0AAN6GPQ8_9BASI|nr:Small ribosomal subunit biogenesis [Tilletia horrida]KAK0561032.1 Small ribosomal subunit biogenesis [Tilletia horrida]